MKVEKDAVLVVFWRWGVMVLRQTDDRRTDRGKDRRQKVERTDQFRSVFQCGR